jgi:D-threo-aldose 1-dehydrogenase
MTKIPARVLGRSPLRIPVLGFGAAAIGNLYTEVDEARAQAAIQTAIGSGIRYFDTSPFYGYGLSEERLGRALPGSSSKGTLISTKVGRLVGDSKPGEKAAPWFAVTGRSAVFDYSRDGIYRSVAASLARLRRERVDILFLHDIDRGTHGEHYDRRFKQALDEALPAMMQLKSDGVCAAVGIGVNETAVCTEFMSSADLDCILLAGRYTLLEHAAARPIMDEAKRRGVAMILGGVFNSGLLAPAKGPGTTYNYVGVDADTLSRAQALYEACRRENVDVGAAALQFALAHPAAASALVGIRSGEEARTAVSRLRAPLPESLWSALRSAGFLDPAAPTTGPLMESG